MISATQIPYIDILNVDIANCKPGIERALADGAMLS